MKFFGAKGAAARAETPRPAAGQSEPAKQRGAALLLLVSVVVGGGGMIGQLLLLRELLVSFYGIELTIGIVLANWLLLEAAGALAAGSRAVTLRRHLHLPLYLFMLVLYAVLLPAALYYSRGAQYLFFGFLPGEAVGAAPLFLASLLLLAPPAFIHGALFPLGCRLLAPLLGERISAGKIYLYETMGTLAGGALFTLFLAERCHSLELALAVAWLHLSGCFLLLTYYPREAPSVFPFSRVKGRILQAAVLTAALLLLIFLPQAGSHLHLRSLERQWGNQEVVHYANSPYGNIVAVYSRGEYTFFYNGRPVITIPAPDRALIADYVHIAAAAHSRPRSVLLLAGGPGGFLDELLKHPVQEVIYVDLDPYLPAAVASFATPLVERELNDPRVAVQYLDGRLFLARTERRFDLIVLGFVTPETLQSNRFFTGEFFSLAGERLEEGGILAFSAPGSPLFLSPEMLSLNAVLYHTLQRHFAHVHVIPGERNIFLASAAPLDIGSAVMDERLTARGLGGEFVAGSYLHHRLDEERAQRLREWLAAREVRLNSDLDPAAFYYALRYWGEAFSPGALALFRVLERLKLPHLLLAVSAVTFLLIIFSWFGMGRGKRRGRTGRMERLERMERKNGGGRLKGGSSFSAAALTWAVFTSGAAGMSLDLLVLFVFQSLYGVVYQMAGLLVASFMAGAFLGGRWGLGRTAALPARQGKTFMLLDTGMAALLLLFYPFTLALQALGGYLPGGILFILVAAFALCGGFVTGAQFPLAVALLSAGKGKSGEAAGLLYSADLCGGWVAGLAVTIVLFPLLGLWQTLLILGFAKLGSFALLKCCNGNFLKPH